MKESKYKSDVVKRLMDRLGDYEIKPLSDEELEEMKRVSDGYGNPKSVMLADMLKAGFNPIGITVMTCEETFIFKTKEEADKGWEKYKPEGWWYDLESFRLAKEDYEKDLHDVYKDHRKLSVHWLDNKYKD